MRVRRRGFMILEMMVAIALLAVFAVVSARLFSGSMRLLGEGHATETSVAQLDSAVAQLRGDVWGASGLETPDDKGVTITRGQGEVIRWSMDGDGVLTRSVQSGAADTRAWRQLGMPMSFHTDGTLLSLKMGREAEMTLASQVRMGGIKP